MTDSHSDDPMRSTRAGETVATIGFRTLIAELEKHAAESLASKRYVLASDADGTIWSGDIGVDLLQFGVRRGVFRDACLPYAQQLARDNGVRVCDEPTAQIAALDAAYEQSKISDEAMVHLCATAFAGIEQAEFAQFCQSVVQAHQLEGRFHREICEVFRWAQRWAIPIWVVSASPRDVVVAGVASLGIAAEQVVGVEVELDHGARSTRLVEPVPYAEGKRVAIQQHLQSCTVLAAFGDNYWDTALLSMAEFALAVRPKQALLDRAQSAGNLRILQALST
jgi:phosphoserine phosphatase